MGLECSIWKPSCIGYAAQAVACDAGFAVRGLGRFEATDSRYTLGVPNIRVSFLDAENCAPKRWVEYDHLGLGMQKLGKECGANCCMLEDSTSDRRTGGGRDTLMSAGRMPNIGWSQQLYQPEPTANINM